MKNIVHPNPSVIDTSPWIEFGEFLNIPLVKSTILEYFDDEIGRQEPLRLSYLCTEALTSKDQAVAILRENLLKIKQSENMVVKSFLAPPMTIDMIDMQGVVSTVAYCFLHGYKIDPNTKERVSLNKEILNSIGVTIARNEGES